MDGGAELRARAISASRSIKYRSSGAMLGYGVLASAARPGCEAHSTATNAKVPNVTVLTIFRFIDFLLRYGFQLHLQNGFSDFHSLLAGVKPLSRSFSLRHSYITGAAVPSDHLPTAITNSVMGSGPP